MCCYFQGTVLKDVFIPRPSSEEPNQVINVNILISCETWNDEDIRRFFNNYENNNDSVLVKYLKTIRPALFVEFCTHTIPNVSCLPESEWTRHKMNETL